MKLYIIDLKTFILLIQYVIEKQKKIMKLRTIFFYFN